MALNPYDHLEPDQLILRDHLAIDRTVLAFERTYLAYVRTGLTFFIAGLTFIKFFDGFFVQALGWVFLPVGLLVALMGHWRFRQIRRSFRRFRDLKIARDADDARAK